MKKPWYIWASLFGFVMLYAAIIFKTIRGFLRHEPGTLDRCMWAIGVVFGLSMCLLLPVWLLSLVLEQTAFAWATFVFLYFDGVFVTYQLAKWKKNHFD